MSLEACANASGTGFLKSSLTYLDCAGKELGSAGYTALIQPGSQVQQLILAAITIVIAVQGIRMMFGRMPDMGDAVMVAAKIGLVLMLVTSWPAVRTLFAEPAISGPRELVSQSGIVGSRPLEDRLQRADDGIVALTKWGTGKLDIRAGRTAEGQPAASEFSGIALTDSFALGVGRLSFLVGALMSLGLLKLMSGIMIAALPLFAGLLLFEASRGLFWGWVKLMFALFIAGFAVPLLLSVELALIEPWLAKAIAQRSSFLATPGVPTELVAMTSAFLLILTGSLTLIARACLSVDHVKVAGKIFEAGQRFAGSASPNSRTDAVPEAQPRTAELSRAANLATTIGRLDQMQRGEPSTSSPAIRSANDSGSLGTPSGSGASAVRQRARQRMALSHARRNQR